MDKAPTDEVEPEARFTFANERTFLVWSRTALALVTAGLAIAQLLPPFPGVPWGRRIIGAPLIRLGSAVVVIQLPRMEQQSAGTAPRRARGPFAAALDPGRGHRGHRADRRGAVRAVWGDAALMAPADDLEDIDPGRARERTALSWTRTTISFGALGAVILKSRPYAGIAILLLSALIWQLGQLARAAYRSSRW